MAKKRRRPPKKKIRRLKPRSRSDWGCYLFQDFGVGVAYIAEADEDGSVEAALFGMDTWCSGLIACHGRRFETKEAFEEAMQDRTDLTKPSMKYRCQEEIAYGFRIRRKAKAPLPAEFNRWRHLVDPLEDVNLPPYLYRCPDCGRGLPEHINRQILQGVDDRIMFYMLCEHCTRSRSVNDKSAEYVGAKHVELIEAIEEIDEFSVTWYQDNVPMLTYVPVNPSTSEGVRMLISEGSIMQAAGLAIESHIACASVPNRAVQDRHVLNALQAVIAGKLVVEDEDPDSEVVDFLVEAIKDGIDMFYEAMGHSGAAKSYASSALREARDSAARHHSNTNSRAYIQFINRFVVV